MENEHIISDETVNGTMAELARGKNWLAYNTIPYFLEKGDIYCFKYRDEAEEFALSNISEYDSFNVVHAASIADVLRQLHASQPPKKELSILSLLNNNTMNQKNFEYLRDQVKFTGFGEGLENELKERMQKQTPKFMILHQGGFGKDETVSTLHFRKSDKSDMYFFNKYDLTLKQENKPEIMTQTFYLNKDRNITLKEAYNLMNGRAINKDLTNKEGQAYNAWVQMDFKQADKNGNYKLKQFHQNYGYDLANTLTKHPIKELSTEQDKTRLLESLHKGNRQSVTFLQNGNEQKHSIEANPQFKSINIYDSNMNRLGSRQTRQEKQGESCSAKQDTKNQGNDDSPEVPKAVNKRKKKQSQSVA
jgi:hypothetical protein